MCANFKSAKIKAYDRNYNKEIFVNSKLIDLFAITTLFILITILVKPQIQNIKLNEKQRGLIKLVNLNKIKLLHIIFKMHRVLSFILFLK